MPRRPSNLDAYATRDEAISDLESIIHGLRQKPDFTLVHFDLKLRFWNEAWLKSDEPAILSVHLAGGGTKAARALIQKKRSKQ